MHVKHQFRGNKSHIERTLDDADAASVATRLVPTQQGLRTRQTEVARQVVGGLK
jgi:hypothetical protein